MPTIIDVNAEAAKLTKELGQTPRATSGQRKGRVVRLGSYRDGILLLGTSSGTGAGHWETHREDELIYMLAGTRTLEIVCDDGPPRSFALHAGTIAIIPRGAWHRFHSLDFGLVLSVTIPGEHIDAEVDDPRKSGSGFAVGSAAGPPTIVDLGAARAKLAMFRGMTPQTTFAERKGSSATLAGYRDGIVFVGKSSGKGHWEVHPEDELVHVLEGSKVLDIVEDDGPTKSFTIGAGMMVIIPPRAWHRFRSEEGATTWSLVIPGPHIEQDVDDPREAVAERA